MMEDIQAIANAIRWLWAIQSQIQLLIDTAWHISYWITSIFSCLCIIFYTTTNNRSFLRAIGFVITAYVLIKSMEMLS